MATGINRIKHKDEDDDLLEFEERKDQV